jgi:hypothetical protein
MADYDYQETAATAYAKSNMEGAMGAWRRRLGGAAAGRAAGRGLREANLHLGGAWIGAPTS